MSEQVAFLSLYPVLHTLWDVGFYFWEIVRNSADQHEESFIDEVEELKDRCRSQTDRLAEALEDGRLKALEAGFHEPLLNGLLLVLNAKEASELRLAERQLSTGLDRLHDFVDTWPSSLFGDWGAMFFFALVEEASEGGRLEEALAQFCSARGGEDDTVLRAGRKLTLDEGAFSVQIGNREPCVLGNTKQYRFLRALAASPNKFVPWVELADRLGGDAHDEDALPAVKCRLTKRLGEARYRELVLSIKSQPGHYGLFWRGAIEM